jgi:hypothetical protein
VAQARRSTTTALGGEREVPVPDATARDYLLLGLRLDQHVPGLVDGYFGPADLKASVDLEQLRSPDRLVDDAATLLERLPDEVEDPGRRGWLTAQSRALQAHALSLAGRGASYVEHVTICMGRSPSSRDDSVFDEAAAAIDRLLPGSDALEARLAAWDERFDVPPGRVASVAGWLVETFRRRARSLFGVPEGEDLELRTVHDRPWTGYNWYLGGLRSRVELNTDLPIRAADLVHTIAHETFPGHHLEHAWKEAEVVLRQGRLESSLLLINAPECLISEGLADLGHDLISPAENETELLLELFERAGLRVAADPGVAADAAARIVALRPYRSALAASRVNAALMRHADGASHDDVLAYLERVGRYAPRMAAKRLEFIEHPLWRTYVFAYHDGEDLLRRWLAAVPDDRRADRFRRLLREQLTPAAIEAEIESVLA